MGLTCFNVTQGKKTNTGIAIHRPFLSLTVGLAAMIHEPRVVSFGASIDDSVLQFQEKLYLRLQEIPAIT